MKTFTRLMQTAAVAVALGCGTGALAEPHRGGPGRDFGGRRDLGGRPEYGRHDGGRDRHGGHGFPGRAQWHGVRFGLSVIPRLFAPRPVYVAPPVVYAAPACAPLGGQLVVINVNDCRRIVQPMIRGYPATIEVRAYVGYPWVAAGTHPSIW